MSIVQVAKLAGVSHATVSRVINARKGVASQTVRAVEEAMKQIGFVPSERRRGPKPRGHGDRKLTLVVNSASATSPTLGFVALMRGVESALAKQGFVLNVVFANQPERVPPALIHEPPDGVLMIGDTPVGAAEEFYRKRAVVWLMANPMRPTWGDQVMPDNEAVGQLAAWYLLDQGHRHLVYFRMPLNHWFLQVRFSAFKAAAEQAGAAVQIIDVPPAEQVEKPLEAAFEQFESASPNPTGVFLPNEAWVAPFYLRLMRRGFKPDEDVAVISCNNERRNFEGLHAQPADIDIRFETIGQLGVDRLLWRMAHRDMPGRLVLLVEPLLVPANANVTSSAFG